MDFVKDLCMGDLREEQGRFGLHHLMVRTVKETDRMLALCISKPSFWECPGIFRHAEEHQIGVDDVHM